MAGVADDSRPAVEDQPVDPTALDPEADAVSRRRARRWIWIVVGMLFAAILLVIYMGRQSGSDVRDAPKAFCKAAAAFEDELERTERKYERSIDRQLPLVEEIAATAPRAIRADAERFRDQMRAVQAAPNERAREKLLDDPEVAEAVANVNRYSNQGCGVYDREGGI